jgi:hypothetical protein
MALRKAAGGIIIISFINGNRIIPKFYEIDCVSSDRRAQSH